MNGRAVASLILITCLTLPEAAITSPAQTGRWLLQQGNPKVGVRPQRPRRGRQGTLRKVPPPPAPREQAAAAGSNGWPLSQVPPPPAPREQAAAAGTNERPLSQVPPPPAEQMQSAGSNEGPLSHAPAQLWNQEERRATAEGNSLVTSGAQEQQQSDSSSDGDASAKQNPAGGTTVSISLHQQGDEHSIEQVAAGDSTFRLSPPPPPPEAAATAPLKRASAAQLEMVLQKVAGALENRRQSGGGGTGPMENLHPDASKVGGDASNTTPPSDQGVKATAAATSQPPPSQLQGRLTYGSGMLSEEQLWAARRDAVKMATMETWAVYEKHAFGYDELRPLSLDGTNNWGNLGMMILDSIDTLYMMGLQPQYQRAALWVANNLSLDHPASLSVFETTIRAVGGLLSIYDLSEDHVFLEKAAALTSKLMPAFEGGVLPGNIVNLNNGLSGAQHIDRVSLAEFGTLQMEFWTLSRRLGFHKLGDMAEAPIKLLDHLLPGRGLLPVDFSRRTGRPLFDSPDAELSMGGNADSYYEYLLKMWILTGKEDDMYRRMWQRAIDEALAQLSSTSQDGLLFIGKRRGNWVDTQMEHLTCFLPGNLALGALHGAVATAAFPAYMQAAAAMTETCWQMYERTATGLAPEEFHANPGNASEIVSSFMHNLLRPEAVESMFYMWRATKDVKYRRMGWSVFQAFAQHSRTPGGAFAKVHDVNQIPAMLGDEMATFWTAETLKYLWLLFGPDEALDLDSWVFNTEAHPLKVNRTGG